MPPRKKSREFDPDHTKFIAGAVRTRVLEVLPTLKLDQTLLIVIQPLSKAEDGLLIDFLTLGPGVTPKKAKPESIIRFSDDLGC